MTLYGRTVQFFPSICVHFDCDRCDCASRCSVIYAARRLQTLQIPGTNIRMWCITIDFGLEMRPSAPNKRLVKVNRSARPSSKQRSPRVGLYDAQKWPLTAQLVEKTAQGWSMYAFCSLGWSSGPSRVDTGRVRLFACSSAPFNTKRATFLSLGLVVAPVRLEYWVVLVEHGCHCCTSFRVHVRFAAAFRVVKGGECFGTSRCPGGVRNV